jgi:predicted MFS family arabinose efflux permease
MVAVIQTSIAIGSTLGGVLFDSVGYRGTFLASAALLLAGSFLASLTARTAQGARSAS